MVRQIAATLFAATLATSTRAALAPDELFSRLAPSVWRVATSDASGRPMATGSAVVTARTTLVTNCHVLKGAATLEVIQGSSHYKARLAYADTERDLCQLSVPEVLSPPVVLATAGAHVGQRIYTIGTPRGLEATLSDGLVSGLRRDESGELVYIQISAPISPGSSGGGLFDDEGRLLGITSAGISGIAQNLNFARPALQIPEIPVRAGVALDRWREARAVALPSSRESEALNAAPIPTAAGPSPLPDAAVRAAGVSAKPPTALQLNMAAVLNKTWIYPHPLDQASYGNVELTFTRAGLTANSKRGRGAGSFDVRDDQLCIFLKSSGTTCYFMIREDGALLLYFSRSGIRSRVLIRDAAS